MRVAILGGGLSGMAAADVLSSHGFEVFLFEKNNVLGGLAASFKQAAYYIPLFYHHVFKRDKTTLKFLSRFKNLPKSFVRMKIALAVNSETYAFTNPLSLLRFDYLSLYARIRYGLLGLSTLFLNPKHIKPGLNARTWLLSRAGHEVTDKVFEELYGKNKFGIPLSKVSANNMLNRFKEKEFIGLVGYPRKGLHNLMTGFEAALKNNGVKIFKSSTVIGLNLQKHKKVVRTTDDKIEADIVLSTLPIPVFVRVSKNLPYLFKKRLSKIRYVPSVTITMGIERFLSPYYWVNILKEKPQVFVQHSILNDSYPWKVCWLNRYGGSDKDFNKPDKEIIKAYTKTVRKYFGDFNIQWLHVFKQRYASPIYDIKYYKNKPDYKTPIKGLYYAGIAVTYPKIRNMNYALESGIKSANIIIRDYVKNKNVKNKK